MVSNHMLYQSKNVIATMASTVANLFLGGSLTIHTSRLKFDEALRTACKPDARS